MRRMRSAAAQKRGGGNVEGESAFAGLVEKDDSLGAGIEQVIGREPTADFAAEVSEESERLLSRLPDESMQRLALLKMEGFTHEEAAEQLECSVRTVERRLRLIRQIWGQEN